jgi:predicted phage terminase large subunit-like protein
MLKEAKQNHYNWLSLYQQTPQDKEGTWVDEEYIKIIPRSDIPPHVEYITAVDLALSAGHGDYTAIITAAIDTNRNLYVVDVHRLQVAVGEAIRKIEAHVAQYNPSLVLVEDSPAEKTMMSVLREYARQDDISIPFYTLPIRGKSKEERAAPIRNWFMEERVHIVEASWTGELTKEIASFPPRSKTEHDDLVDALGLIGRHLGRTSTPNEPKTIKQQLKTTQDMCLSDLFKDRDQVLSASSYNRARI